MHDISILGKLSNSGVRGFGVNFWGTTLQLVTAKAIQKSSQITEEPNVTLMDLFHTYSDELFENEQMLHH